MEVQEEVGEQLEDIEEINEEESEFEERVYVDELEEDLITQYYNQENNFKTHIAELQSQELTDFKESNIQIAGYAIYSTSTECPKYKLIQPIQEQLDNQFTKKIRVLMQMDDLKFQETLLQQLLTRKTTIITSNSFQHRIQARECTTSVIASYICQKFAFVNQLRYQQQLMKQKVINEQQFLENEVSLDDIVVEDTQQQFNGYTRPQVLVLLPTKHHAWRFISILLASFPLLERKNIANFKKFERLFAPDAELTQYEVGDQKLLADELPDAVAINEKKPKQFYQQFCGDLGDEFSIGIGMNKRGPHAMKLFQQWDKCDIIVASPLGLMKNFDWDLLSSIHTCYMEIDYLLDSQQQSLQKLLLNLFKVPYLIKDQNILTISEPYIWNLAQQACQFIVFQNEEHEVTNGLFNPIYERDFKKEFSVYTESAPKEEKVKVNQNAMGMTRIKQFDTFKAVSFQAINMEGFLNIYDRKTDLLPPNALKFDLLQYPKLDYAINKLLTTNTVFYVQNSFMFLRFKFVMKKLNKDCAFINEELGGKEIGQEFARFRKAEVENLILTEKFLYQRRMKLVCEKIVFVGVPQYKEIFEEICENAQEAFLLWDAEDAVRMQNIMSSNTYDKVIKQRVVIV